MEQIEQVSGTHLFVEYKKLMQRLRLRRVRHILPVFLVAAIWILIFEDRCLNLSPNNHVKWSGQGQLNLLPRSNTDSFLGGTFILTKNKLNAVNY